MANKSEVTNCHSFSVVENIQKEALSLTAEFNSEAFVSDVPRDPLVNNIILKGMAVRLDIVKLEGNDWFAIMEIHKKGYWTRVDDLRITDAVDYETAVKQALNLLKL